MTPRPRRRLDLAAWIGWSTAAVSLLLKFAVEVLGNNLGVFGSWVPWAVIGVAVLASFGLLLVRHLWHPPPSPKLAEQHVDALVGRDDTVTQVVAAARTHAVLVHGPSGIGTSSVAITAARKLVPDKNRQLYVDLRGVGPDDGRSVRIRVLRTLGLPTRRSDENTTRSALDSLRYTGKVLVIDNVTGLGQVLWIRHRIPGAYLIIAGDVVEPVRIRDQVLPVPVGGLAPDDALRLLAWQDTAPAPGRLPRLRAWLAGRPVGRGPSITRRITADETTARRLATGWLGHPRVVIGLGRRLSRNPETSLAELLETLPLGGTDAELRVILKRQLEGATPGARRLLSLLTKVPELDYTAEALAELVGVPHDRVPGHIEELRERFLLVKASTGFRITSNAAPVADRPPGPRVVRKGITRLIAHYARDAEAGARTLSDRDAVDADGQNLGAQWFQDNDVTLQGLLAMPNPPRARRAAVHLWRIADALDAWFVREQRSSDRKRTAEAMAEQAGRLADADAEDVAHLRLAAVARAALDLATADEHLRTAERHSGRRTPQQHTAGALQDLMRADLTGAYEAFTRSQETRTRQDDVGRAIDSTNLATVDIRRAHYDAAEETLTRALHLARLVDDHAGQAHVHELLGIIAWYRRHPEWDRYWTDAHDLYERLGDDAGQARCLLHHATALLASDEPYTRVVGMLEHSLELRGDPDAGLGPALTHLLMAEYGPAEELRRHRRAGLAALAPWDGQPAEPAEVTETRARLTAVSPVLP